MEGADDTARPRHAGRIARAFVMIDALSGARQPRARRRSLVGVIMADLKEARVPDIGHDGVPVIEVLVKAGDRVEKEQSLITLESDKATMEVPSPFAGTVKEMKLKVGDEVSEGAVIALIEADGAAAEAPAAKPAAAAPAPAPPAPAPAPAEPKPAPVA